MCKMLLVATEMYQMKRSIGGTMGDRAGDNRMRDPMREASFSGLNLLRASAVNR